MSEWRDVPLGDVLTLQRGFDITKKMQRPGRVPVVSSSGVGSFHDEARAGPPGVVVGRKGLLGSTFFLEEAYWPHDTTLWVKDFKGNDPYFCYLALKNLRLEDLDAGSSNPTLNRNHAHLLPVAVPQVRTQRRIAAVLSAFDKLIEINERRIQVLEDLVRSLYGEWFVRFRFPGHERVELVDSELGRIPDGWAMQRLREIADLRREGVVPSHDPDTTFEHFSIPAFDAHALPDYQPGSSIKSGKHLVAAESVLLSKINPRLRRVWFANPRSPPSVASTEFLVWNGTRVSNAWLWSMFLSDSFREWLVGIAGGTSTSHQRVKPGDLIDHKVAVAQTDVLAKFDELAIPCLYESHALRRHNHRLASTRDLLLPRLVTGRLNISELDLGDLLQPEAA